MLSTVADQSTRLIDMNSREEEKQKPVSRHDKALGKSLLWIMGISFVLFLIANGALSAASHFVFIASIGTFIALWMTEGDKPIATCIKNFFIGVLVVSAIVFFMAGSAGDVGNDYYVPDEPPPARSFDSRSGIAVSVFIKLSVGGLIGFGWASSIEKKCE